MTHSCKVARPRRAQCQASQNTLQIAHLTQHRLQLGVAILQRGNGLLTTNERIRIADGHMQPALQPRTWRVALRTRWHPSSITP